jgi:hypothetical protein
VRKRFQAGQSVWVSPSASGHQLVEDTATIVDDLGDGYIVLQESERVSSHGMGHFVQDVEVADLVI